MSDAPLMPKATAVWLVEKYFADLRSDRRILQTSPFGSEGHRGRRSCDGHQGLRSDRHRPADPRRNRGRREGRRSSPAIGDDESSRARVRAARRPLSPLSRRQDRAQRRTCAVRNHAELKDAQIMRLVGTTKHTLEAIRERSHWNSANLQPMDPVTLGLCSQIDLDFEVNRAAKDRPKTEEDRSQTLVSAEITTRARRPSSHAEVFGAPAPKPKPSEERVDVRLGVRQAQDPEDGRLRQAPPFTSARPAAVPGPVRREGCS